METSAAPEFAPVRFSTALLPERERIAYWREIFGRSIVKVEIEPVGEEPFRCEATIRPLPGLVIADLSTAPARFTRSRALLADGDDDFVLIMHSGGRAWLSQLDREAEVAAGDAGLMLNAEPGHTVLASDGRIYSLSIPCRLLEPMVSGRDAALARLIPGASAATRLLRDYVDLVLQDGALATPELRHAVAAHIRDLAALAIGATRDAAEAARGRGVRAARLRAIKQDIARNLGRRDLSIAAVAARQGVSPRYVGMLFEAEGTSFSAFVLAERLARAHRLLTDPGRAQLRIGAIAFELGFGDLSHFNRSFRARYGGTPSELRAAAGGADGARRPARPR
jgi:AraC-like DNA-binding protein